jgi:hypothetical protein
MTEAPDQQLNEVAHAEHAEPQPNTYEALRDELPGVSALLRDKWQRADRASANLLQAYQSLQADADITQEARSRRADEFYARESPRIEQSWRELRAELTGAAGALVEAATPRPKGERLAARSNEEILAAQGERERILRTIERRANAPGPFKPAAADHLRDEYERGIAAGGALGAAICRGALDAGRELGHSEEAWIAPLRDDTQLEALEKSRTLERAAYAVPSRAPKPGAALNSRVRPASKHNFQMQKRQTHFAQQPSNLDSSEPPNPFKKTSQRSRWK